jgi:hypothetical protein
MVRTSISVVVGFVLAVVILGAVPQVTQSQGRYQLAGADAGVFMLDSFTGRVWRYSHLMEKDKSVQICRGVENCFFEIDRKRFSNSGYVTEMP